MVLMKVRVFRVQIPYIVIFVPILIHAYSNSTCLCSHTYSNFEYVDDQVNDNVPKCLDNFDICYDKIGEFYQITQKNTLLGDWSSCSSKCDENNKKNNENIKLCRIKPTKCLAGVSHNGVDDINTCFTSKMCKVQQKSCGENEKCKRANQTNDDKTKDLSPNDFVCNFNPNPLEDSNSYGICQPDSCLQDGGKLEINIYIVFFFIFYFTMFLIKGAQSFNSLKASRHKNKQST